MAGDRILDQYRYKPSRVKYSRRSVISTRMWIPNSCWIWIWCIHYSLIANFSIIWCRCSSTPSLTLIWINSSVSIPTCLHQPCPSWIVKQCKMLWGQKMDSEEPLCSSSSGSPVSKLSKFLPPHLAQASAWTNWQRISPTKVGANLQSQQPRMV